MENLEETVHPVIQVDFYGCEVGMVDQKVDSDTIGNFMEANVHPAVVNNGKAVLTNAGAPKVRTVTV